MDHFDRGTEWFLESNRYFTLEHDRIEQLSLVKFGYVPWMEFLTYVCDDERLNKDSWCDLMFITMFGLKPDTFINVFMPRMAKYDDEYSFLQVIPLTLRGLIVLHWACQGGTAVPRKVWRRYSGIRYEECENLYNNLYAKCMEHYVQDFRGTVHEFTRLV